jgi:hypothetical protein
MQWWVIVRLQVAVPPMWQKEARKHGRLEMSKRAIIKQDVKHVAAMILYRHSAEGWWVGPELSNPRGPLPVL